LFLPACSPDFNPIELANAKLNAYPRGAKARAFDPLVDAIGEGRDRITEEDARAFVRHCGYEVPE
ncbi:MAG: IS630 family transposase, partial [Thermomicrobiales bacterium]|nr:IS630 family transposase [Thermomicrobiales bacterium]